MKPISESELHTLQRRVGDLPRPFVLARRPPRPGDIYGTTMLQDGNRMALADVALVLLLNAAPALIEEVRRHRLEANAVVSCDVCGTHRRRSNAVLVAHDDGTGERIYYHCRPCAKSEGKVPA